MNKQIEKMAKTLCEDYGECKECTLSNPECENPCMISEDCERLYTAGYRRQDEVAREIFAEIEKEIEAALESNYAVLSKHLGKDNPYLYELVERVRGKIDALRGILDFTEELKKKYEVKTE